MKDLFLILVFVLVIKLLGITINTPVVKDTTHKQVAKTEIIKAKFEQSVAMLTLPLITVNNSNLGLKMPIINVPLKELVLTHYLTVNRTYNAETQPCFSSTPRTEIYSDS